MFNMTKIRASHGSGKVSMQIICRATIIILSMKEFGAIGLGNWQKYLVCVAVL